MPTKRTITLDDIPSAVGTEVGASDWRVVTQEMINAFAEATDDHQWIHLDAERAARETPYGGTIAHGFLTISLLSTLAYEALPDIEGATMGMNYGFDKVRFTAPVKTGARVRAVFVLTDAQIRKSGRVLSTYEVKLEVENTIKPALTATWIIMSVVERD
ncbi:MAG: MaoC family dehydratase [Pseudomonadota bacterium]